MPDEVAPDEVVPNEVAPRVYIVTTWPKHDYDPEPFETIIWELDPNDPYDTNRFRVGPTMRHRCRHCGAETSISPEDPYDLYRHTVEGAAEQDAHFAQITGEKGYDCQTWKEVKAGETIEVVG
jgi:hypothetical protein